jgi:hypothetical protein
MDMSYVGPGDYANSSKVLVSVSVHWDYKHFNRDGGTLNVTVDGVTDTRTAPFNAGETSSGSQTIYSAYWNVGQPNGNAKTVYASVTFQATSNTAATVTDSLYLSAVENSGGDTGGDSGGDTGGDSGGGDSGDGGDDDDEGGGSGDLEPDTPLPGNATSILQANLTTPTSAPNYKGLPEGTITYSANESTICIIKFTTPDFDGASTSLVVRLYNAESIGTNDGAVSYALCDSDSNNGMYIGAPSVVNDPNQIACGQLPKSEWRAVTFTIQTDALKGQNDYYIILWQHSDFPRPESDTAPIFRIGSAMLHGITVNYESSGGDSDGGDDVVTPSTTRVLYIYNGTEPVAYQCFIDNGTNWEECEMYIDNGTTYELYG